MLKSEQIKQVIEKSASDAAFREELQSFQLGADLLSR